MAVHSVDQEGRRLPPIDMGEIPDEAPVEAAVAEQTTAESLAPEHNAAENRVAEHPPAQNRVAENPAEAPAAGDDMPEE